MITNKSSEEIYKMALEVIPGGVSRNTIFRKPYPNYVAHAKGCYVSDIDGVERIDFANNMASLIHGHAHPAIVEAVTEQLQKGTAYTMATEAEVEFARLLSNRVKTLEKLRFVNSGTEAVMAMIKASRAFTGRPKIVKCEGAYHGTYDYAEISQTANPTNWGDINKPNSVPLAHGTPKGVLDDVIIIPFNDTERAIKILDTQAEHIAAILIDPVPHRIGMFPVTDEFIEAIYKWTRNNGALLIFDEVITLRVNYGGAQQTLKVKPDLTAMGKIIGGGFPVGAFGGRADIMKVLDPTESKLLFPHSGTFSANPITTTAGRVAMELFDEKAISKINAITQTAIKQIKEAISVTGIAASITGAGSMFRIHLKETPPSTYRNVFQPKEISTLINELLDYLYYKENIMMINTCSCMFSTAITQKEVDRLSEAIEKGFRLIKPKLDSIKA